MLKQQLMAFGVAFLVCSEVIAAARGRITDLNGAPVAQAMVTLTKAPGAEGATATTVFSNTQGEFAFQPDAPRGTLTVRALNYRQVVAEILTGDDPIAILMRPSTDQSGVAPASAYLKRVTNSHDLEAVVMACVGCHQLPAAEVRDYANLLDDTPETQSESAREEAWAAIVKQMNYVSDMEFGRTGSGPAPAGENISVGDDPTVKGKLLARTLRGPLHEVRGYQYGAPLIVTPRTTIREFEVPGPNAIREAVPFEGTKYLYAADVSTNRLIRIDTRSGAVNDFVIPDTTPRFPHTLVPGPDGIWVGPFAPGSLLRFDPHAERWKIWPLGNGGNVPVALHDISFDADHRLVTDRHGRVWYSDILNNAVGWLDPKTGKNGEFKIPPVAGRVGAEQVYGLAMSPDRVHVWYCQVGIGSCGSFNTETQKFETHFEFESRDAGPRRISMSESGMLYIALFGAGQLAAYDTNARRMISVFDLPDRASAPYLTTWDPVRKVLWIPTANADVIYRFDPQSHAFGVLPLPRERGFLRMLHIDRKSGMLVTCYANIVQHVRGPRMALLIDPGDGASDRAAGVAGRTTAGEVTR
jgi:streptogramin lyase